MDENIALNNLNSQMNHISTDHENGQEEQPRGPFVDARILDWDQPIPDWVNKDHPELIMYVHRIKVKGLCGFYAKRHFSHRTELPMLPTILARFPLYSLPSLPFFSLLFLLPVYQINHYWYWRTRSAIRLNASYGAC